MESRGTSGEVMPLFLELNFSGIGNTIIFQLENLNLATAEILFALFCARFYQLSGAQLLHKCAESGVDEILIKTFDLLSKVKTL